VIRPSGTLSATLSVLLLLAACGASDGLPPGAQEGDLAVSPSPPADASDPPASCGWGTTWPTVASSVATAPLVAPSEEAAEATLRALGDALSGLPPREFVPAAGPFDVGPVPLATAWPPLDPAGCATVTAALALPARPPGGTAETGTPSADRSTPDVLLSSPETGSFALWIDRPERTSKGTVLVRFGHSDSFADHDARVGDALREAGWTQVFLQARLYQGRGEDPVTRQWLRAGSSLLRVRVQEAVLAGAWVRAQPRASGHPVGLLGHSGGGVQACLVPRVFDGFDFVVSDFCSDLALPESTSAIGDGFVPELLPVRGLLGDVDGLATPVLVTPYNFEGATDRVVRWLATAPRGS